MERRVIEIEVISDCLTHAGKKAPQGTVLRVRENVARYLVNMRLGRLVESESQENNNNKNEE